MTGISGMTEIIFHPQFFKDNIGKELFAEKMRKRFGASLNESTAGLLSSD